MLIDESSYQRAKHGAQERCCAEQHHWSERISWNDDSRVTSTYVATCSFLKTSEMAPPETDRNADPANPVRNRKIMCTATLLAVLISLCRTSGFWIAYQRLRESSGLIMLAKYRDTGEHIVRLTEEGGKAVM